MIPEPHVDVDALQEGVQGTSGVNESDDSNDEEVESHPIEAETEMTECSGLDGCGASFPVNEKGSDGVYAKLCAACYSKQSAKNDATSSSPVNEVPEEDKSSDDERVINRAESFYEDEDSDLSEDDSAKVNNCGKSIGGVLSNVLHTEGLSRYDVVVSGYDLAFEAFVNDQDHVTGKTKKFFQLIPNPTPLLFGYKHYHGIVDLKTGRGWLCHTRLKSIISCSQAVEGDGWMLWEIWETRCDRPRLDGTLLTNDGNAVRIKNLQ